MVTSSYCSRPIGEAATSSARSTSNPLARSRSHSRHTSGWISPIQPASRPPTTTRAARPGCRNGCASRLEPDLRAELGRKRLEDALEGEEVGGPLLGGPAGRRERARRERRDAMRLEGGRLPPPGELRPERPADRRAALGEVHASGLEQGDPLGAPGEVVASHVEERPEQRRAKLRVLERQRVGDPDRRPPDVAGLESQPPGQLRVHEAQGDDRVEAEIPHDVLGAPAQRLLARQAPRRRPVPGQGRGQMRVVAVDPPHLLDQVGLARDVVVAVRRDLGRSALASRSTPNPSRSR